MSVDRIVTYDEISDKRSIFLNGLAFSHLPLPELVEESRRKDRRLLEDFAFFAEGRGGQLLGRAGVGMTEVTTKERRLRVGVIWGVRTAPWWTRRGVA